MPRVLVAEDSVTARELLVSILRSDPEIVVVGEAKNGVEAVAMTKELHPDVITMDIRMPMMDGFEATRQINRMVLNLLDIAGSSDGVFAPRPATIDVPRLVEQVQQLMTPAAEGLGQEIRVEIRPALPPVQADPELLRRVLQNLVDNALRHSPQGNQVGIEADASDGVVVLRVRDCGPGVPAALRDRIFDKYVRIAGRSGEGGAPGKGLGLAFCRMAVEAHGGRIWVEDNQPRGSVFVVTIPTG